MVAIELVFPTGRYHATPWDQHHNEGVVEWPPAPWRLLRALVATWYLKAREDVAEPVVIALVDALSSVLPRYRLAGATPTHTRHYMPRTIAKENPDKTFDPFLHVGAGSSIEVMWPGVSLGEDQQQALATLLARVGYLGRAESLVEARLLDAPGEANCFAPGEDDVVDESSHELTRVLAPVPPVEIGAWRADALARQTEALLSEKRAKAVARGKPADSARLSAADHRAIEAMMPASVFQALHADTATLQEQAWTRPPGTRWATYARPRALVTTAPSIVARSHDERLPTVARYAVAGNVAKLLTDAVQVAGQVRKALMSHSDAAPVFSGRDPDGQPARDHRHAFILPEANGRHGRITHVTIYAPMGFDAVARRALDAVRRVWCGGAILDLVLLGVGQRADFAGENARAGQCPLFATAVSWVSLTPFVPTRHPKQRNGRAKLDEAGRVIGAPDHDLVRLLAIHGYPAPAQITSETDTRIGGKPERWTAFRTQRNEGGGRRGPASGCGFRISFAEPVIGPIVLGYGAHFGLGVFVPERST